MSDCHNRWGYGVYRGVGPYSGGIPPLSPRHIVSQKGGIIPFAKYGNKILEKIFGKFGFLIILHKRWVPINTTPYSKMFSNVEKNFWKIFHIFVLYESM